MRVKLVSVMLVAVLSALAGCSTMGGGSQLQNTVYDTHRRVVTLDKSVQTSVTNLNQTNAELSARVDNTDQQLRSVQSLLEENQVRLTQLHKRFDDLANVLYREKGVTPPPSSQPGASGVRSDVADPVQVQQPQTAVPAPSIAPVTPVTDGAETAPELESVSSGLTSVAPEASTAPAAPAVDPAQAEADYQAAQQSFAKKDFRAAYEQFSTFTQKYPASEHVSNALFWEARSLQGMEDYESAIKQYEQLRSGYPSSRYVSHAMHQQAVCHARLGQTARAIKLMEDVVAQYPVTPAAEQAKEDLKKLQSNQ